MGGSLVDDVTCSGMMGKGNTMGAIREGLLYGLGAGAVVLLFGVYMQRRQAKNPHGKCAYCGKTLAMMGKYATVCPHCKMTQPWVTEGKDA